MSDYISVNKGLNDVEIYKQLLPQLESLIVATEPLITGLANFSAAIYSAFEKISWAGFYFLKNNILYLGPFQGKPACTAIDIGSGVCGKAAKLKQTLIVPDVNKFPGHIACDPESKSEIVVPLINAGNVLGVFDVDSTKIDAFSADDKFFLEKAINSLIKKLNIKSFNF